jgi:hypothetical protein
MTSLTDLREVVDVVIGVDTHVKTHSAAVIDSATGGVLGEITVEATAQGYAELVEFANKPRHVAGLGARGHRRPRRRLEPPPAAVIGARHRGGPSEAVRATQWRSRTPLMRSELRARRWRDRGGEPRAAGANPKPCQCF